MLIDVTFPIFNFLPLAFLRHSVGISLSLPTSLRLKSIDSYILVFLVLDTSLPSESDTTEQSFVTVKQRA